MVQDQKVYLNQTILWLQQRFSQGHWNFSVDTLNMDHREDHQLKNDIDTVEDDRECMTSHQHCHSLNQAHIQPRLEVERLQEFQPASKLPCWFLQTEQPLERLMVCFDKKLPAKQVVFELFHKVHYGQ